MIEEERIVGECSEIEERMRDLLVVEVPAVRRQHPGPAAQPTPDEERPGQPGEPVPRVFRPPPVPLRHLLDG